MGSMATVVSVLLVAGIIAVPFAVYFLSRARSARLPAAAPESDTHGSIERLLKQAEVNTATILRQAERDAETLRKEALLEAREKAHEIATEAERLARERHREIQTLDQALADKTRALADRLAATDQIEKQLQAREQGIAATEQSVATTLTRAEQMAAERQRELQRVAGLTSDEARELLLRQLESEARRDCANLVKRLEA